MSYDVYLTTVTVDGQSVIGFDENITYNLAPMFRHEDDLSDSLRTLNGMTARDAAPVCERALLRLLRSPDKYIDMEPANGWGDYPGAVRFLCRLVQACSVNPSGKIEVG